jgi:hypothetical protein
MIYITYYTLEMKKQTMTIMLANLNKPLRGVSEPATDYSGMTVMVKNSAVEEDLSCIPWDEMGVEEDFFPEESESYYQGLPIASYRRDLN